MNKIIKALKKPFLISLILFLICGLAYPLALTAISKAIFPAQSAGSLITVDGKIKGSQLVGQDFMDERFMKGRPSAVKYNTYTKEQKEDGSYAGISSGSNNYAPTNPKLTQRVEDDMNSFLLANPSVKKEDIPTDMFTASGSGLDPHISTKSASIQIPAMAKITGLSEQILNDIVKNNTQGKFLGIFGEETVNVLKVNLDIATELGIISSHP